MGYELTVTQNCDLGECLLSVLSTGGPFLCISYSPEGPLHCLELRRAVFSRGAQRWRDGGVLRGTLSATCTAPPGTAVTQQQHTWAASRVGR